MLVLPVMRMHVVKAKGITLIPVSIVGLLECRQPALQSDVASSTTASLVDDV